MKDNTEVSDFLKAKGDVTIEKVDSLGNLETIKIPNLVVSVGKNYIASRMASNTANIMSHMAVGTGTGAAAIGNTLLGTEIARVALTSTTPSNNTVTYVASYPAGTGTGALTEAGVFNGGVAGANVMLCRTVFSAVNKTASDAVTITWVVSIT